MGQLQSDSLTEITLKIPGMEMRNVMVTGFDNHNNREVAREIPVPLGNNFEKFSHKSSERLCRHTHHQGGKRVSKCWAGVGCEAASVEDNSSYLLFLDTCDGVGGGRYCSTQFIR